MDWFIDALNTPLAQALRTIGYISLAVSMWAISMLAISQGWRFRFTYVVVALHMSVATVWAGLLAAGVNFTIEDFNTVISLTATLMFVSSLYSFFSKDKI